MQNIGQETEKTWAIVDSDCNAMKPNITGFLPNLQGKIKQVAAVSQYKQISRSGKVQCAYTEHFGPIAPSATVHDTKKYRHWRCFPLHLVFHSLWSTQLRAQQRPCDLDSWTQRFGQLSPLILVPASHLVFHNGTTTLSTRRLLPPLTYLLPYNEMESQSRVALFVGPQGLSSA